MPSVKINPAGVPKTVGSAVLRTLGNAVVVTNILMDLIGVTMVFIPPVSMVGAGLAVAGAATAKPSQMFRKHLMYQAKLMDIKGLLSQRDMGALKTMFNRTQKVKNLLDPYEKWSDVPKDLKSSLAQYIDEYYRTMSQLQQALYLAQAQYDKKQEKQRLAAAFYNR